MKEKKEYDFYTVEDGKHFAREKMTTREAQQYAQKYALVYEEVIQNR